MPSLFDSDDGRRLADHLQTHLFDRGNDVRTWPPDEQELFRDLKAWNSFGERTAKVQRLRFEKAATALLTVGWRPPLRRIETVEELHALPPESVVLVIASAEDEDEPAAIVWVQEHDGDWAEPGSIESEPASEINLPVWLLWSPPLRS